MYIFFAWRIDKHSYCRTPCLPRVPKFHFLQLQASEMKEKKCINELVETMLSSCFRTVSTLTTDHLSVLSLLNSLLLYVFGFRNIPLSLFSFFFFFAKILQRNTMAIIWCTWELTFSHKRIQGLQTCYVTKTGPISYCMCNSRTLTGNPTGWKALLLHYLTWPLHLGVGKAIWIIPILQIRKLRLRKVKWVTSK